MYFISQVSMPTIFQLAAVFNDNLLAIHHLLENCRAILLTIKKCHQYVDLDNTNELHPMSKLEISNPVILFDFLGTHK